MITTLLSFVLLAGSGLPAAAGPLPDKLLGSYLKIQTALAADSLDGVKLEAAAIRDGSAEFGASATAVKSACTELEMAGDLKAAREAFGRLSAAMVKHLQATGGAAGAGVKLAYCPMVKQSWLQKGSEIANPYYGKAMPGCGELREMAK